MSKSFPKSNAPNTDRDTSTADTGVNEGESHAVGPRESSCSNGYVVDSGRAADGERVHDRTVGEVNHEKLSLIVLRRRWNCLMEKEGVMKMMIGKKKGGL
jgi:hypothetical protein